MGRKVAPKPLIGKLAEACDAVGGVPKKGQNEEYNWQRWADIAAAFRHELFHRGIVILADDKSIDEKIYKNHAGLLYRYACLTREYRITDGPETITIAAFGRGMDVGDKAIWKAKTGCDKYLLRELGLIPDEADEPEATEAASIDNELPKQKARMMEYQRRAWATSCEKGGKTKNQAEVYLVAKWGVSNPEALSQVQFDEAVRWALGMEELGKTLALSVESQKQNGKQEAH